MVLNRMVLQSFRAVRDQSVHRWLGSEAPSPLVLVGSSVGSSTPPSSCPILVVWFCFGFGALVTVRARGSTSLNCWSARLTAQGRRDGVVVSFGAQSGAEQLLPEPSLDRRPLQPSPPLGPLRPEHEVLHGRAASGTRGWSRCRRRERIFSDGDLVGERERAGAARGAAVSRRDPAPAARDGLADQGVTVTSSGSHAPSGSASGALGRLGLLLLAASGVFVGTGWSSRRCRDALAVGLPATRAAGASAPDSPSLPPPSTRAIRRPAGRPVRGPAAAGASTRGPATGHGVSGSHGAHG